MNKHRTLPQVPALPDGRIGIKEDVATQVGLICIQCDFEHECVHVVALGVRLVRI